MSRMFLFAIAGVTLFLTIVFFVLALSVRNRLDTFREQDHFTEIRDFVEGSFVPQNDNLNIIILRFKDPGLASKERFKFSLEDSTEVIRVNEFSGDNLGDPSDLRFQFEPITKSQGRPFTIRVEKEEEGPPVAVAVDKDSNLSFTAFYRVGDKMSAIESLVRRWLSFPTGDPMFFVAWFLILAGVIWKGFRNR